MNNKVLLLALTVLVVVGLYTGLKINSVFSPKKVFKYGMCNEQMIDPNNLEDVQVKEGVVLIKDKKYGNIIAANSSCVFVYTEGE